MAGNNSSWEYPVNFYFQVDFQNRNGKIMKASFYEIDGLGWSFNTESTKDNSNSKVSMPTGVASGTLTLKRPLILDDEFTSWIDQCSRIMTLPGGSSLRNKWTYDVVVKLLNAEGSPIAAWSFERAFPTNYKLGQLKADSSGLAIETIDLEYSRIERVV